MLDFILGIIIGIAMAIAVFQIIDTAPAIEITEEQAIDKLHETGWLIRHDKEMTERPTGKWYYNYQNGWHCSICHESVKDMPTVMCKSNFAFCPNCGAKMEKGDEENGKNSKI